MVPMFILTLVLAAMFGAFTGRMGKRFGSSYAHQCFRWGFLVPVILGVIGGFSTDGLAQEWVFHVWVTLVVALSCLAYGFSAVSAALLK